MNKTPRTVWISGETHVHSTCFWALRVHQVPEVEGGAELDQPTFKRESSLAVHQIELPILGLFTDECQW